MEPGLEETEGGGEKEGWMMTLSPGVVGAVWMALDHVLFKHTWQMHSLKGSQKETGGGDTGLFKSASSHGSSSESLQ